MSQQKLRSTGTESRPDVDLHHNRLDQFQCHLQPRHCQQGSLKPMKMEINIPLLDAIKQIPKYTKFLKKLSVHKRKKMKEGVELGGIVSALTRNDDIIAGTRKARPKKCRDPGIFFVPCIIGDCTFADAMLDLGALINVMPTSIYKSLN
ncbi:hypothetical protein CR513_58462, partial [Mucuna pruriens]